MELSKEQEDHILEVLTKHRGSYSEVAKELRVPSGVVRQVDIVRNRKYNYTEAGRGPKHIQKYLIATTRTHTPWDNENPLIKKAREDYDAGKIEMCTGRDGLNLLLYAIPRKMIDTTRKPYFSAVEEEINVE